MKMQKKKLLLLLILVVSIMAIIITASQIYEIVSNEKVIDNNINGIDGEENKYLENESSLYSNAEIVGTDYKLVTDNGPWVRYDAPMGGERRNRYVLTVKYKIISLDIESQSPVVYNSVMPNLIFTIQYNQEEKNFSGTAYVTGNNLDSFNYDLENIPHYNIQSNEALLEYNISQIRSNIYYVITPLTAYSFHIDIVYIGDIACQAEVQFKGPTANEWGESSFRDLDDCNPYVTTIQLGIEADLSSVEAQNFNYGISPRISIETNELLQVDTTINNQKLSQYIYEKITAEWGEGKELATLKCSIGEYYDEEGNLAISTKQNNLPMLFDIGDLVIPYIAVANGKTEPLSIKLDGTPKVFKVTQIRPYFDGAFWQEITLQEQTT